MTRLLGPGRLGSNSQHRSLWEFPAWWPQHIADHGYIGTAPYQPGKVGGTASPTMDFRYDPE